MQVGDEMFMYVYDIKFYTVGHTVFKKKNVHGVQYSSTCITKRTRKRKKKKERKNKKGYKQDEQNQKNK